MRRRETGVQNKEEQLYTRDKFYRFFPGGHTNLKSVPKGMELIIDRAEGAKLWDSDGNEYLDFACTYSATILGHRHPQYINALHQLMDSTALCVGGGFGFTENDVALAEKLIKHVPCAERVKLTTSGTEAIQAAMRIARAYTGRPYVLQFHEHYHGWMDNSLGPFHIPAPDDTPRAAASNAATLGRALGALDGTLVIEWNDIAALEKTLSQCGDQIAMIVMEAYASNAGGKLPLPGYLERVRELCDQYGIVLCFDEVQTGFRVGLNSAQGFFGVTPDLTTLGKALGGGMPIAAVVGRAQVMEVLREGKTVCAGTYMGHFLSVQAALTTIEILEANNGAVYQEMDRLQQRLVTGLKEIARRHGVAVRLQGVTGLFSMLFGIDPDKVQHRIIDAAGRDFDMASRFWERMKKQQIYVCPDRWFLNTVHTDQHIDRALAAANNAMENL